MSKRSKFELFGDILEAIRDDISKNGNARLTRVHGKVNVPYDRFKIYVENLKQLGLVQMEDKESYQEMQLTDRAFTYLSEYTHVKNFMLALGLDKLDTNAAVAELQ